MLSGFYILEQTLLSVNRDRERSDEMYEKIEAFCKEHGISIASFESMCGLSDNCVYKLKTNFNPQILKVKRMAEVLGITVDEFIGKEE